jgi:hypothetical protein
MTDILNSIKSFKASRKNVSQFREAAANKASTSRTNEGTSKDPTLSATSSSRVSKNNKSKIANAPIVTNSSNTRAKPSLQRDKQDFSKKFKAEREKSEVTSITRQLGELTNYQAELSGAGSQVSGAKQQLDGLVEIISGLESANSAGDLDNASIQAAKSQMLTAISAFDRMKKTAEVQGVSVFSDGFDIPIAGENAASIPVTQQAQRSSAQQAQLPGTSTTVSVDVVPKPTSVTNLSSSATIESIVGGNKDSFGSKIQVSGNYLAIAAKDANKIGDDGVNDPFNDGAIDIFNANSGAEIGRFRIGDYGVYDSKYSNTNPNASRQMNFGADFDIEGNFMVVGAPSLTGQDNDGTAFLYKLDGDPNRRLVSELKLPNAQVADSNFGKAVEIAGGKVFVSSNSDDSKIYTFDLQGTYTGMIEPPSSANFKGVDITASGDNIFISSSKQRVDGESEAGEVYVYDKATNAFKYRLKSPNVDHNNEFGTKIEAFGDLLAVSEPRADFSAERTGKVHLYKASTGAFVKTLETSSQLRTDDKFGSALAMSEKYIAVTASGDDSSGSDKGAVYVFDKETGVELAKITDSNSEEFGSSLAFKGNTLYIGEAKADVDAIDHRGNSVNLNEAGVVKKYDISSLEATANTYKQQLAAQHATGIVAKGLDVNYLKKMDLGSLSTQTQAEAAETLQGFRKNVRQIRDYVSKLNSNFSQGLETTSSTISALSKRLNNLVPDRNISVNSANIRVQANINRRVASRLIP